MPVNIGIYTYIVSYQIYFIILLKGTNKVFQGNSERTIKNSIDGSKYMAAKTIANPLFIYADPIVVAILPFRSSLNPIKNPKRCNRIYIRY